MRKPIITQAWLADFYADGVKSKYKGSIKRQATGSKHKKRQASSIKRGGPAHNQAPNLVKKKI